MEARASRYYRRLFSSSIRFPATLYLLVIITLLAVSCLDLRLTLNYILSILAPLTLFTFPAVLALNATYVLKGNKVRRICTLIGLIFFTSSIADMVLTVFRTLGFTSGKYGLGYGVSTVVLMLLFCTLLEWNFVKSMTLAMTPVILSAIYFYFAMNYSIKTIVLFLFSSTLLGIATYFFSLWLNRGTSISDVKPLELFKGFAYNWLTNDPSVFEEILHRIGTRVDGWIKAVRVVDERDNTVSCIIQTSFHTGPFRNIGGSMLPKVLVERVERELKCIAVLVHGPGGHERDPVSRREVERIVEKTIKTLSDSPTLLKVSYFKHCSKQDYEILQILTDKVPIITISIKNGIDDLPYELNHRLLEVARKKGYQDIMVIEAHNRKPHAFNYTQGDIDTLTEIIGKALDGRREKLAEWVEVGVARSRRLAKNDDICENGVTVILMRVGEELLSIIVVDGNNMKPGLREKIIGLLRKLGVKHVEVLTTDNHAKTAVKPGEKSYLAVGDVTSEEDILNEVESLFREAYSNMSKCRPLYIMGEVKGVQVIGSRGLEILMEALEEAGRKTSKVLPILASIPIIVGIVLGVI